jgi:putative flippase GtrA
VLRDLRALSEYEVRAVISPRVERFLRYTGVNLASVSVDYASFLTLTHFFGMPVLQSIVAYSLALALNYDLSRRFVFVWDVSGKSEFRLMAEFLGTGLLGLVLTAIVTGVTIHYLGFSPVVAKTTAVLICFLTLYVVRSRLVFKTQDVGQTS